MAETIVGGYLVVAETREQIQARPIVDGQLLIETDQATNNKIYIDMNGKRTYVGGTEATDYIIERGTSGYWTYVKYKSGYVEMWGKKSVKLEVNWGKLSGWFNMGLYPFEFEKIPTETFTYMINTPSTSIYNRNYIRIGRQVVNSTTESSNMAFTPTNDNTDLGTVDITVNYHTFGKIKQSV